MYFRELDGSARSARSSPRASAGGPYGDAVSELDWSVGEVLAALRRLGLDENTLLVFTSDNGPHQEGGHDPYFFPSAQPLRGFKRDLYEGGIRVPMIVRAPGRTCSTCIVRTR